MKLYLVAGEASGDARGAELIRSLRERREGIEFRGFGGPQMAIYTIDKQAFHQIPEGLPTFERLPKR